ncbi:MAG: helix-turn-helix transcriptional regulator, partial [Planctomycetes bacterium]|nr:helix-turn-helix transcriptional regulator [Planctomycetota bacterium]
PARPPRALVKRAPSWVPRGLLRGQVRGTRVVDQLLDAYLRRWATRRGDDRLLCRATLLELLARLLASGEETKASGAPDLAHEIKIRLDRGLAGAVALPALLADLGRSYEHLCRVFTACYGMPPLRYLTTIRLERSRELLAAPGASVAAVARSLGYGDPAYFSRLFRAEVGSSPRRFRSGRV